VKPLEDFHKSKTGSCGRHGYCKPCVKLYELENRPKNRARRKEYGREYHRLRGYKYTDAQRAWHRDNYQKNKARLQARNKAWAKANPDKIRRLSLEGTNRRNARLRGAEGSHTHEEWTDLVEKCGHRCVRCGEAKPLTKDHIVPLIKGGSDYIENIQPLCQPCNSSKGGRIVVNYLLDPAPTHVDFI
jgi:5-methylcytosine-specific restriction endonuclease McrA